MTDYLGLAALVGSVASAIVSVGTFIRAGLVHDKVEIVEQKAEIIKNKVTGLGSDLHELEVNTNSIKDALLLATAAASRAEGVTAGIAQERLEGTREKKK